MSFLILLLHYKIVENMQMRDVIYLIEKEKLFGIMQIIKYQEKQQNQK